MDKKRLKAELALKDMSLTEFAAYLGIKPSTLYRKTKGESDFVLDEVLKTRELLGVEAANAIFFDN